MANRYLLVNVQNNGIYAWDTQLDIPYAGNPIVPASFKAARAFLALSGDSKYCYARGGFGTSNPSTIVKIDAVALTYVTVPANFGNLGATSDPGPFLCASDNGAEFYAPQYTGTTKIVAINGTTGNPRTDTGAHYAFGSPQGGAMSYDGTVGYACDQSTVSTFSKFTVSGMTFAVLHGYSDESNFEHVVGFSADGSILYGVYKQSNNLTYAFVGIKLSDGSEVGRYAFTYGSTSIYPVLSPDRTTAYLPRGSSPYQMIALRLSDFTVISTTAITSLFFNTRGSFDATGRYIYFGSSTVSKYDTQTNTYQQFSFPGVGTALDSVLTPGGFPFSGGGAVPSTPVGLAWNTPTKADGSFMCQGNKLLLFWQPSSGASGYRLRRDGVIVYDGVMLGYPDMGVLAGQSYSYTISAYNNAGESAQSSPTVLIPCSLQAFSQRCVLRVGDWQERCPVRSQ